jgi:hypothetical protein
MEITDFDNYLIYPDGKVFNKNNNKFRKLNFATNGYQYVALYKDGKQKNILVHRLIAIHYIPNPENKPEVDHINRDKTDNRLENLRWATRIENAQNTGKQKNNKSGYKNISFHKYSGKWEFKRRSQAQNFSKYFDTLEEAVDFKNSFDLKK